MKEFRLLRADEIDVRIAQVGSWGATLLLYKDARADMQILDETVGPMNWQRRHVRDNANCIVSIWDEDKRQWIQKEDTGTESYSEAAKGLASDSFKRACVTWGVGRELYTSPQIFVRASELKTLKDNGNGRWTCKDYFTVNDIQYTDRRITYVQILNNKTGTLLDYGKKRPEEPTDTAAEETVAEDMIVATEPITSEEPAMFSAEWLEIHGKEKITEREIENLKKACAENDRGLTLDKALTAARRKSATNLTYVQYVALVSQLGVAA